MAANTLWRTWLDRRGRSRVSTLRAFPALALLNALPIALYPALLATTDGASDLRQALFIGPLLTLSLTL
jgi:hypothetical protein